MIEVKITKEMVNWANGTLKGYKEDKRLNPNKYGYDRKRTFYGYIGQAMVIDYLGLPLGNFDTFEYDIPWDYLTWEVKSISTKVQPEIWYEATINGKRRQKADNYIFTRMLYKDLWGSDGAKGWIVGWIPTEKFWEIGLFKKKGEALTSNPECGNLEQDDATMVKIHELNDFEEYVDSKGWLKGKNIGDLGGFF